MPQFMMCNGKLKRVTPLSEEVRKKRVQKLGVEDFGYVEMKCTECEYECGVRADAVKSHEQGMYIHQYLPPKS